MDVSNASLYDASTATPEAAFMAMRLTQRQEVLVARSVHPEYQAVLKTYARGPKPTIRGLGEPGQVLDLDAVRAALNDKVACLVVQQPNFFGQVESLQAVADAVHAVGALLVVMVDPVSLGILARPGDYGADIVVGDGQSIGNAPAFGGPHVGFLACRSQFFRQLPGRIVGMSRDAAGERAYTLTLQTREQHIRREKATSNICTNQALNALAVTVYLSLAGEAGLSAVARLSAERAHDLAKRITAIPGFRLAFDAPFLNEFVVRSPIPVERLLADLRSQSYLAGVPLGRWYPDLADCFMVAVTEMNTPEAIDGMVGALRHAVSLAHA